ncbi:DUF421 domain-containing protein [Paenibacillus camelliae]|uniref:YetF domain-containing protein n=1 Tax=Paenibacillus camelliae TaxID=512410 RepID=UPI00203DA9DF|nr:DUF421 domain-containing protein [Paenibacillus camelliae]MCM3632419.1 DUF421 domain-containing protein [Paenibacillus camelliae]
MDWIGLSWRTLLMYVIVFIVLRLMGKREIGKLSVFDLVISVMIAELAVIEIEDPDSQLTHGLIPIAILLVVQFVTAFMSLKSRKLRLFLDGKPSVIMAQGQIYKDELKKQRYNLDDLMTQLREQGIASIDDVEFAILETSGKLSVIPKPSQQQEDANAEQASDQNEQNNEQQAQQPSTNESTIPQGFRYETLPIPLIMDGKVQDNNLEKLKKTRFWLKNVIQEKGATQFKEVLLCTIDHKNRIYIDIEKKDH